MKVDSIFYIMAVPFLYLIFITLTSACFGSYSTIIFNGSYSTSMAGSGFYLNSSLSPTGYNKNSINMTACPGDSSTVRVVPSRQNSVSFVQTVISSSHNTGGAPYVTANGSSAHNTGGVPTAVITNGSYSISMAGSAFYLNSSLSPTWYNNNSINMTIYPGDSSTVRVVLSRQDSIGFVCGFYCIGTCSSYLFSVVVVGDNTSSLVWSANRDYPVKEDAILELTGEEGLVLQDSDGTKVWSTNISGNSILGMNITEAGNLVLFDSEGAMVWQSFDHPVDSLLVGQRLYEGQKLIASSSSTNWSLEPYYATLTAKDGFAVFVQDDQAETLMYYQLVPDKKLSNSTGSNYAELQQDGFLVNMGASQVTSGRNPYEFPLYSTIEFIKLEGDGHLRIHQLSSGKGFQTIVDLITVDLGVCQHPLICGEYGVCREGQCSCPEDHDGVRYFHETQSQLPDHGCSRITALSCGPSLDQHHLMEIKNATYFSVIDLDAASPNIKDMEECKQACLQNCSCSGAFFRYEKNTSDGYCFMPSKILSLREEHIPHNNFSSATFIKVQIPFDAPPRNKRNLAAIVAGSSAGVIFIICLAIFIYLVMLRKSNSKEDGGYIVQVHVPGMLVRLPYEDIRLATEDFKERLGQGGFGSVFKGMLADGTRIAVKRLDKMSQGMREFLAEVETIGSIHHFNLVRLIGFCAEKSNRLLVYEYMSNGSLENWIFYDGQRPCLDWQTRKKIVLDIAKGLAYLHEECRQRIVHLDIKPQNILLDENFNAKVSDFGLSKLIDRDENQVHSTMRGTPGYLAPELRDSKISVKADIYSFGIVLLEIVSGRKNFDRNHSESSFHMLRLLQKKAEEDRLIEIVENRNQDMQNHEEVVRMIRIGAWCLQDDPTRRPSMSVVVKVLEGVLEVEPSITFKFFHAITPTSVANNCVSSAVEASVLSNPR